MRYAIFAAVSTEAQAADDKVSLTEQVTRCRAVGDARGWNLTGEYVVPGESRTRWINLRDAEREIPRLGQMLDDAQGGLYDVLVVYDFNRLRDLLTPVSKTLAAYSVQLFSVSQPVEPIDPRQYSPYASDASQMMQGMSQIISQAQVADLRRKYAYAMPKRISQRGLPMKIPWGYRKPPGRETDPSAVPIQDTDKCAVLVKAKDALLSGATITELVSLFDGTPPPRGDAWHRSTIYRMLKNPFYAGVVSFGASRLMLDPRTGERKQVETPAKAIRAQGKHIPLWDAETYSAILAELKGRGHTNRGHYNRQVTSLVYCGTCGAKMWLSHIGTHDGRTNLRYLRCSTGEAHVRANYDKALPVIAGKIKDAVMEYIANPSAQPPAETVNIDDLLLQRKRLEDAYQAGVMSLQSYTERIAPLTDAIEDAARLKQRQTDAEREHAARLETLMELAGMADKLPAWILHEDAAKVNRLLRAVVKEIIFRGLDDVVVMLR